MGYPGYEQLPLRPANGHVGVNHVQEGLILLMVFKKFIQSTGLAVELMVCEKFIRYAGLAVGPKPSAMGGEGRLRGLYRF